MCIRDSVWSEAKQFCFCLFFISILIVNFLVYFWPRLTASFFILYIVIKVLCRTTWSVFWRRIVRENKRSTAKSLEEGKSRI